MKKSIRILAALALVTMVSSHTAQAQTVGAAKLDYSTLYGNQSNNLFNVQAEPTTSGPLIQFFTSNHTNTFWAGSINFLSGTNGNNTIAHSFQVRDNGGNVSRVLTIYQNQQIRIGNQAPSAHPDYKLSVDGKLTARSVYVIAPNAWADFVFAPAYKPLPLPALEAYLKANQHLPAVPAAQEVVSGGYSVTEMDAKLLQSVEELTLHVIALNKQNQRMQADLVQLRQQLVRVSTQKHR